MMKLVNTYSTFWFSLWKFTFQYEDRSLPLQYFNADAMGHFSSWICSANRESANLQIWDLDQKHCFFPCKFADWDTKEIYGLRFAD